jgi:MerC mercury resistance protein
MRLAPSRAALDWIGSFLSITCALHCLLTPLLVASVSLGALGWLAGEGAEVTLLSAAATLAVVVLGWGWRSHRRLESLGLFAVALILVSAGRFLVPEAAETPMVVAGGLSIALAHVLNARLCRSCTRCRIAAGADPPRLSTSVVTQLTARSVTRPPLAPWEFTASANPTTQPDT